MLKLNRRTTLALLVGISAAALTRSTQALDVITYTKETLASAADSGKPYLIDFFATWCTTCAAQERVLEGLYGENPAYAAISIVRVDWDENSRGELVRDMGIPRRSTLVLMRGTTELGRLVAETGKDAIADLLNLAAS